MFRVDCIALAFSAVLGKLVACVVFHPTNLRKQGVSEEAGETVKSTLQSVCRHIEVVVRARHGRPGVRVTVVRRKEFAVGILLGILQQLLG